MSVFFLTMLTVYVVLAALRNRYDTQSESRTTKVIAAVLHTLIFASACCLAAGMGAFSRQLASPVHIGAGLLAGHLIFGLSLLVTHLSWRAAASHFFDLGPLWEYVVENPMVLLRFMAVSIGEEVIYRAAAQPLAIDATGSTWAGILTVAVAFCVVHRHFFRNPSEQSIEFAGFALFMGVLYYWTGSLILVLVIHAVRNIEIAYLEETLDEDEQGEAPIKADDPSEECRMPSAFVRAEKCHE